MPYGWVRLDDPGLDEDEGWISTNLIGNTIAPEGGVWLLDWSGFLGEGEGGGCHLIGNTIAPEGGVWLLDWSGFLGEGEGVT